MAHAPKKNLSLLIVGSTHFRRNVVLKQKRKEKSYIRISCFTGFIFTREACMETTGRGRNQRPKVRANLKVFLKMHFCPHLFSYLKIHCTLKVKVAEKLCSVDFL